MFSSQVVNVASLASVIICTCVQVNNGLIYLFIFQFKKKALIYFMPHLDF